MISAIVLTRNEEKNILECVTSLSFCNEIIVIDDFSTDGTLEIIDKLKNPKIKVFKHKMEDFSKQRNFGLEKAKNEWVLFVDADERISSSLEEEISNIKYQISNDKYSGFYIRRRDIMWGKELKHGESGNIKLLRLAKKDGGRRWKNKVHEIWGIKGNTGELKNSLLHYPHQSITEFLREINEYTDIRARELFEKGVKTNFFFIILYPASKFVKNYFLKLGYLDGTRGLIFNTLMSFHSFLVRSKLWCLNNKSQKEHY